MVKWAVIVGVAMVGLVGLVALVGVFLPKAHRESRTTEFAVAPSVVFDTIAGFARASEWRPDVTQVDVLPDDGRGRVIREHTGQGVVPYRVEVYEPPTRLVMRIDDHSLPYAGAWIYELHPEGAGTRLTITEEGEVFDPVFRVMQKFFFSPYATIDRYVEALHKRLHA